MLAGMSAAVQWRTVEIYYMPDFLRNAHDNVFRKNLFSCTVIFIM